MPLSTTMTPSRLAAKRTAHEAADISGAYFLNSSFTLPGTSASAPPFTGSITTTGFPCRRAVS